MNWNKISEILKTDSQFYLIIVFVFVINIMGFYFLYKYLKHAKRGGVVEKRSPGGKAGIVTKIKKAIALLRESDRYLDEAEAIVNEVEADIAKTYKNQPVNRTLQAMLVEVKKLIDNARHRIEVNAPSRARLKADSDDEVI